MSISKMVVRLVVPLVTLVLSGCFGNAGSGGASELVHLEYPHDRVAPGLVNAAPAPVLYVAQYNGSRILLFDPRKHDKNPIGQITDGVQDPMGLATDNKGDLYVLNTIYPSVTMYPPGSKEPSFTISKGISFAPYGLAVDSSGDVFVSEQEPDAIVGYRAGSTSPFERITFKADPVAFGIDREDDLIVINGSEVVKIPHGTKEKIDLHLEGLTGPEAVSVRGDDALYVSDFDQNMVFVYPAGKTKPSYSFGAGMDGPIFSTFGIGSRFFQVNQNNQIVEGFLKNQRKPFAKIYGEGRLTGVAAFPK
ncbi:MAG TPA: hypothetical protein VGF98_13015 [Candidatus Tumulicola sp.]